MNTFWRNFYIIFRREFKVRVQNKLFIIATLGTPLLLGAVIIIPAIVASQTESEKYEVAVIDPTGLVLPQLKAVETGNMTFEATALKPAELKMSLIEEKGKAALIIPDDLTKEKLHLVFHSAQAPSMKFERDLQRKLQTILREQRLAAAGLSLETVRASEVDVDLTTKKITQSGKEEETSSGLAFILGYGLGFICFMMVFIYGSLLMKGVMEEKTSRIVEVIISSVRPFELMLGKVLGIASVGLLQFAIWVVLLVGLAIVGGIVLGVSGTEIAASQVDGPTPEQQDMAQKIAMGLGQFKIELIFYFLFYFLGGYLLYGGLFAAVGASIDQEADAGPLTTIISIPAYLPLLLLTAVMNNPDSNMSFWLSVLPFSSPTIMIARMALIDVPFWQILLSMVLLIASIAGSVWVAARIYRVGLLMYGKKITVSELIRWIRVS